MMRKSVWGAFHRDGTDGRDRGNQVNENIKIFFNSGKKMNSCPKKI
jgi:hypothetical protein